MQSSRWCIGYDRAANDARPRWINARRPADISSPNLGVVAVAAGGPGLRRGHVIYSGVFAVGGVPGAGI
jgi:hypothetical protein